MLPGDRLWICACQLPNVQAPLWERWLKLHPCEELPVRHWLGRPGDNLQANSAALLLSVAAGERYAMDQQTFSLQMIQQSAHSRSTTSTLRLQACVHKQRIGARSGCSHSDATHTLSLRKLICWDLCIVFPSAIYRYNFAFGQTTHDHRDRVLLGKPSRESAVLSHRRGHLSWEEPTRQNTELQLILDDGF